jgi:iron complex outermembrane receptor protein
MAFDRVMRTILCGSVSLIALTGIAAAQTKNLNIPAEDLKVALDTYIRQSGVQLVYTVNDLEGARSTAVHGEYEAAPALDRMLQGTKLAASRDPSGAVIVSKRLAAGPDVPPDDCFNARRRGVGR